jgi:hypothetical protein
MAGETKLSKIINVKVSPSKTIKRKIISSNCYYSRER